MKPPWSSLSSVFDIILAIVNNPPPEAEGSPVLRDFVRCALVKDAVARPSADVLLKHKLVAGARSDALAAVVKKGAKRKAEPSAKAEGKRRAVLKKKAGKETPSHSKLAKKRSSKKK